MAVAVVVAQAAAAVVQAEEGKLTQLYSQEGPSISDKPYLYSSMAKAISMRLCSDFAGFQKVSLFEGVPAGLWCSMEGEQFCIRSQRCLKP